MRARSSISLSLRRWIRQLRISCRISLAASLHTPGLKFTKNFPHRFFDRRGLNRYPRKTNFSSEYLPLRSPSLQ
jgi:hypothetical protein